MKSFFAGDELDEPEDQRNGRWLTPGCHAGKAIAFAFVSLYGLTLLTYCSLMIYKLRKYQSVRRVINFYVYVTVFLVMGVRIASTIWLILYDDLHGYIEVVAISIFLLCNTATLLLWARRWVLFRFEESSEYYSKIKAFSHILAAWIVILISIIQILGIVFEVHSYINTSFEAIFTIINLYITWKIVKYFKIFDFNETKRILKWVYILSASILVSYVVRLTINLVGITTGYNLLTLGENLNGRDKLIHFSIIILIEYVPILIWILYIAFCRGELERTLSVSIKSNSDRNYGYQKLEIGGTITGTGSSSRNTKFSEVIESF